MGCDAHSIPNTKLEHSKNPWILIFIQTKATLSRHCSPRLKKGEHKPISAPVFSAHLLSLLPCTPHWQGPLCARMVTGLARRQGAEPPFTEVYFSRSICWDRGVVLGVLKAQDWGDCTDWGCLVVDVSSEEAAPSAVTTGGTMNAAPSCFQIHCRAGVGWGS